MKEFSTFSLARMMKTNRSVVQAWIDRGFIKPSVFQAEGVGTKNLFSIKDVYRIFLFKALYEGGLPQREASDLSGEIDLGELSDDKRFIILKRKLLNNGKFSTDHCFNQNVTTELIDLEEDISLAVIIDGLKLRQFVEHSI